MAVERKDRVQVVRPDKIHGYQKAVEGHADGGQFDSKNVALLKRTGLVQVR